MTDFTPFPAAVTMSDHSAMVGTTATQIFAPGQLGVGIRYMRITNPGTNAGYIWISRTGTAAVGAVGSYVLPPGSQEIWDGTFVPVNALSATSTQANTLLIVEIG